MNDELTWGVDLTGSPWPSIRLVSGSIGLESLDDPGEIPGADVGLELGPLLAPAATGDPLAPVLDDWSEVKARLRSLREPIRALLPERTLIGVAYPRSMPPLLRQYLPIVLGADPATSQGGLPAESLLVGLEAPAALALEAIACRAIEAPGVYAVATGRSSSTEWTALEWELMPPTNPSLRSPILRIRLGRTAGSPSALGLDGLTPRIVVGDVPGDGGSTVRLGATAIASGAARFARWRRLEFSRRSAADRKLQAWLLPGTPLVSTETIHPLGLVGGDGRGSWFWRRLFDPGTPIPSPRVWLRSTTSPPCQFSFAEITAEKYPSTRWLGQSDWAEVGLRWHSTYLHSARTPVTPPCRWSLELRDFNDTRRDAPSPREEVPPRWGLPTWITRLDDTPDAQDPVQPA